MLMINQKKLYKIKSPKKIPIRNLEIEIKRKSFLIQIPQKKRRNPRMLDLPKKEDLIKN